MRSDRNIGIEPGQGISWEIRVRGKSVTQTYLVVEKEDDDLIDTACL